MHLSGFDLLFWAAGFAAHVALLLVLLVRRRAHDFPIFTSLIGLNVGRTIALFFIEQYSSKSVYFYTFWSLAIVDVTLQIAVVCELVFSVFCHDGRWVIESKGRFFLWGTGSTFIAAALTLLPHPAVSIWQQAVMIRGNLFSAALLSELFVGTATLAAISGLPWNTHAARIAQGLGGYSLVSLAIEAARTYLGLTARSALYEDFTVLRKSVYLACVAYWIVMLWRQVPTRKMTRRMKGEVSRLLESAAQSVEAVRSRSQV
jgi:hypothetical protein